MPTLLERLRALLAPDYRVDELVGSGGMAHVFRGRDLALDHAVAFKVLRPELFTEQMAAGFLQEARYLADLRHPNIVTVHGVVNRGGLSLYVMDYLEGVTLEERLSRGPLSPAEARDLARGILDGLAQVHARGVVHRDIKPGNILLTPAGPVLTDFGIAIPLKPDGSPATEPPRGGGTKGYESPEQAAGRWPAIDQRTDVYSMGLVLYEAWTGRAYPAIMPPGAVSFAGIPGPVAGVLRRALAIEPERRWRDAAAFGRALAGADLRRRRVLAGAGFVALAAGAVALWLASRPPRAPLADLAVLPFAAPPGADTLGNDLARATIYPFEFLPPTAFRLVPPQLSFSWWDSVRADPAALARDAGPRLHAKYWATGDVVMRGDSLTVRARVFDARGVAQNAAPVSGSSHDPCDLGYRVAVELARIVAPGRASDLRPGGCAGAGERAMAELFRGDDAFAHEAWGTAADHYARALAIDSSLAYARWKLAITEVWRRVVGAAAVDLPRLARDHAAELSDLDRSLLDAMLAPAGSARAAAYSEVIRRYPQDAMGAMLYGWELLHRGALAGVTLDSAAAVLRLATGRNSFQGEAWSGLAWARIRLDRPEAADSALRRLAGLVTLRGPDADVDIQQMLGLAFAARFGSGGDSGGGIPTIPPDPKLRSDLGRAVRWGLSFELPRTEEALGAMLAGERGAPAAERANGYAAQTAARFAMGRGAAGVEALDRAALAFGTAEGRFAAAEWRVLLPALGDPVIPPPEVAAGRKALERASRDPAFAARAAWALAIDARGRRDTAAARRWERGVAALGPDTVPARLGTLLAAFHAAADGDLQAALDSSGGLLVWDESARGGDPFARAALHLARGDWFLRLNRPEDADSSWRWYENADVNGWPDGPLQAAEVDWVLGPYARLLRARLAASAHDAPERCRLSRRVLAFWEGADPTLAALRAAADSLHRGCPR